jgi:hypothetical protein
VQVGEGTYDSNSAYLKRSSLEHGSLDLARQLLGLFGTVEAGGDLLGRLANSGNQVGSIVVELSSHISDQVATMLCNLSLCEINNAGPLLGVLLNEPVDERSDVFVDLGVRLTNDLGLKIGSSLVGSDEVKDTSDGEGIIEVVTSTLWLKKRSISTHPRKTSKMTYLTCEVGHCQHDLQTSCSLAAYPS